PAVAGVRATVFAALVSRIRRATRLTVQANADAVRVDARHWSGVWEMNVLGNDDLVTQVEDLTRPPVMARDMIETLLPVADISQGARSPCPGLTGGGAGLVPTPPDASSPVPSVPYSGLVAWPLRLGSPDDRGRQADDRRPPCHRCDQRLRDLLAHLLPPAVDSVPLAPAGHARTLRPVHL